MLRAKFRSSSIRTVWGNFNAGEWYPVHDHRYPDSGPESLLLDEDRELKTVPWAELEFRD